MRTGPVSVSSGTIGSASGGTRPTGAPGSLARRTGLLTPIGPVSARAGTPPPAGVRERTRTVSADSESWSRGALVADHTEDLREHVVHRHDAEHLAVLAHDERHVHFLRLERHEQPLDRRRARHEQRLVEQLAERSRRARMRRLRPRTRSFALMMPRTLSSDFW